MSVDWHPSERVVERAREHAVLADPQRLAMVDELSLGDRSPGWFSQRWGLASNLLAHHSNILVQAGLVERTRSEADRRRVYLHLTDRGRALIDPPHLPARRVVFVCTHNSARSQFAEALWREASGIPAQSAGTAPADRIHPLTRRVAQRHGVDLRRARPKQVTPDALHGAVVVTVCDQADERTRDEHLHWSVPDPVTRGAESDFACAWDDIAVRIHDLALALDSAEQP